MSGLYNTAKICPFTEQNCVSPNLNLDPDITKIMAESHNYDELEYVWNSWHNQFGQMRQNYVEYVELMNKVAAANGKLLYTEK